MIVRPAKGFISIFMLLLLPSLITLLVSIYAWIALIELKNEFRFKCITESLILQNEFLHDNSDSLKKATQILKKLGNISSPLKYQVILANYPKSETRNLYNTTPDMVHKLIYELHLKWISIFYIKCGVKAVKTKLTGPLTTQQTEDIPWQYEIIYTTKRDKF